MQKPIYYFLAASLIVFVVSVASAGIAWESKEAQVQQLVGKDTLNVQFHFRNAGTQPVKLAIKPSCGCTSVTADRTEYAPGASGILSATIAHKASVSDALKSIVVQTDSDSDKPDTLTVKLIAPPIAEFSPNALKWQQGDALIPRKVVFSSAIMPGIAVTSASAQDSRFRVSFERILGTEDYAIWVEPVQPAQPLSGEVKVVTSLYQDGVPRTVSFRVRIER